MGISTRSCSAGYACLPLQQKAPDGLQPGNRLHVLSINALRAARTGLLSAADKYGLNTIVGASEWRRQRLLILCYHGVSQRDEHEWADLYVSPAHLRNRLELLRQAGANILPLTEALERLAESSLPEKAVCLTFDDGAFDFRSVAMPILSEFSVPATLYLTTYYCGRRQPVFNTVVSYLLWKGAGKTLRLPGFLDSVTIPAEVSDPAFSALHVQIKSLAERQKLTADQKDELARALAMAVGVNYQDILDSRLLQIMDTDDVRALDQNLIDIQLHTHRHRTPRDQNLFRREITDNARVVTSLRPHSGPLSHFCYPSGDYTAEFGEWLRKEGIRWATTCDPGLTSKTHDPLFLPRFIDTEKVSVPAFLAWISGLGMFTHARRVSRVEPL